MNIRTILSVILIGFVTVSIVYLVVNETRTQDQEVSETTGPEKELAGVPDDNPQDTAGQDHYTKCTGCEEKDGCAHEKESLKSAQSIAAGKQTNKNEPSTTVKTIAYYFHGEVRCATCRTIEAYAKQVLSSDFHEALDNGLLEFREVNIDDEENEHYIDEFELTSSSLVLVQYENGKMRSWKVLEKVWTLVGDEDAFKNYTRNETSRFMKVKT